MKLFTMILMLLAVAGLATAQETTPAQTQQVSACYTLTYTKNLKGDYKKLLKVMCEKEIREAGNSTQATSGSPGSIGVASRNTAVTTVTYRNSQGEAFEASKGGAKLKLALRQEDRKEAVGVAKAENPTCGWLGCYTPVVGYGGGGYVNAYQSPR